MRCIKFLLFAFNFVFWVSGAGAGRGGAPRSRAAGKGLLRAPLMATEGWDGGAGGPGSLGRELGGFCRARLSCCCATLTLRAGLAPTSASHNPPDPRNPFPSCSPPPNTHFSRDTYKPSARRGGEHWGALSGACWIADLQLAGLAVIAFGLWLRFGGVLGDLTSEEKSPEYFYMGLYVLVGAGALMMTVGFFGCCGAVRESQCLLGAFFACLLVIFAAEVTAGVFAFIGKKAAVQEVQTIYEEAYKDYVMDMGKSNKTLIQFHTALQCCGKESEVQVKPTCPEGIQLPKNCLDEIQNLINSNLHLVGIVGIGIAGITIFGMIFSMVLCCAIRNTRDML
ncbi:tetraspanin-2 isoform X1 [Dermochelys coriacea]|uniref:tetraspanin-2 isoform X1 n=1 Tax=Dermochelys coriacea TaxID=27794 RepID=UPI001CA8D3CC|nr:tetraspanin-2 isoform X1 [Dermochelys coriacea]